MPETLLTASEVAERLKLHIETVYRLIQNEALPAIKVGRQWRFVEDEIQRWMYDRRQAQTHKVDEVSSIEVSSI